MRVSTQQDFAELEILLNLAKLLNNSDRTAATNWFNKFRREQGYCVQDELECFHKAILILDQWGPRVRIKFSYVDEGRSEPVRAVGSFFIRARDEGGKLILVGGY